MPSVFTGIPVPTNVSGQLAGMRYEAHGIRWVDPLDYHITVRFIGKVSESDFNRIDELLSLLSHFSPFSLRINNAGIFGGSRPRAIYATVKPDQNLIDLYRSHERIVRDLGLRVENREFVPHITLARIDRRGAAEIERVVARYSGPLEIDFPVAGFALYSSDHSRQRPYVVERQYPFLA